jgi:hypothetical protein
VANGLSFTAPVLSRAVDVPSPQNHWTPHIVIDRAIAKQHERECREITFGPLTISRSSPINAKGYATRTARLKTGAR